MLVPPGLGHAHEMREAGRAAGRDVRRSSVYKGHLIQQRDANRDVCHGMET